MSQIPMSDSTVFDRVFDSASDAVLPESSIAVLNQSFNEFLRISQEDVELLRRFRPAFVRRSERFAELFYKYLHASPETAEVLQQYESSGGCLDHLIKQQTAHLEGLADADPTVATAEANVAIGALHHRWGIKPVWMLGSYLLYLNYLRRSVREHAGIDPAAALDVVDAALRFLFRDMGFMLEGYWEASHAQLRESREHLRSARNRLAGILENVHQVLWSVDVTESNILYLSPGAKNLMGPDTEPPVPYIDMMSAEDRATVTQAWSAALAGKKGDVSVEVQLATDVRWLRFLFVPYSPLGERVVRVDGIVDDVTSSVQLIERLHRMAITDDLTGLPNRVLFRDRLGQALAARSRRPDTSVAVLAMDLNDFKEINETLGREAGDRLLFELSKRMRGVLRESDTLARMGGDEFGVVSAQHTDAYAAVECIVAKIVACFADPFEHHGELYYLRVGIGVALAPEHGEEVDTLVRRADVAMHSAQKTGATHVVYADTLDKGAGDRLRLTSDVRAAITEQQLVLHYQPIVNVADGTPLGVEALVRWHHPDRGWLMPGQFLPLVERVGLSKLLTEWVMAAALRDIRHWSTQGHPLRVSVNVSGGEFQAGDLAERVKSVLVTHGVSGSWLQLEVTEHALMRDIDRGRRTLQDLHQLGVSVAIDDFGTGHSSLAYLKDLPVDVLKIDKSFVEGMLYEPRAEAIVRLVVDLARNLRKTAVAEGVQDEATLRALKRMSCEGAQGYHLGEPMEAADVSRWVDRE